MLFSKKNIKSISKSRLKKLKPEVLVMDGISIEIIRKPIKNMHFRVYPPHGEIRISAPLKLSLSYIQQQLETKREWLHQHRNRMLEMPPKTTLLMETGEHHYYLGKPYELTVINSPKQMPLMLKDNLLLLYAKPKSPLIEKQAHLKRWYEMQMRSLVPVLIEKWQPIIGVSVASWGTKIMKTRWGSCNVRTRKIWLNLVLIQKPLQCLEYVIVHELVHLLEASHNSRFYQFMDTFMPDWRTHKETLAC